MKLIAQETAENIRDYGKIIIKSLCFTILMLIIWYVFMRESFCAYPENEEVMSAVVAGFLVFSALLPTFTVSRLSQQYDDLKTAVIDKNFDAFQRIYKKTVHPLTYLAIIVVSLLAILALMMLPYARLVVGFFSVGGLSFVHCFFFYITKELDNPDILHLNIPKDWLDKLKK